MSQSSLFIKTALDRSSLLRGFYTSLIVGRLLNLINLDFDSPNILKALLTYCVPLVVSIYSATAARLRFDSGMRAAEDAQLKCSACSVTEIDLQENEIIPECPHCKDHTQWNKSAHLHS
ncbi:hypothetical protein [Rubritalea profundi]|uniref:Uncharacterized protein n=1 Tax=Rubritalea profundi TaxID=1658618 RepID=A0A2S7U428_9BACT|nr:hypothetical protein [Rubritalea profundi]PQJ29181.1 hypothetical protein BSZ32_12225 [Rubritalea profundi]